MRECSRLRRTRAALRPSWSACSPIRAAARASVRPPGGERWSGIRWDGWCGTTPNCWNRSGEKRWVANRASGLQPVLARREHRVRRGGARPRPPRDLRTRLAFRRVAFTVFLTEQLAQSGLAEAPFMRRAGHRVIPNGVDCDLFHPNEDAGQAFRRRRQLGDGPVLLGVGALEIEKRWDLLLEGLALLAPPVPPLLLCGTGALDSALRGQAQRLALDVRFVGQLDPPELAAAYNAATCIVHTRPDEVFSLALLEALACGRPVLAASGGGTPELLGNAGVLAPPENPVVFAGLLRELLGDAPRRASLAVAARQRAVERYSVARMIRDYEEMLEDLV